MNDYYLYILRCADGSYYIGHTNDLDRRLYEHNSGIIKGYTSTRLPVKYVFADSCRSKDEAITAEYKIKKWSRTKKEVLINGGWEALEGIDKKLDKRKKQIK